MRTGKKGEGTLIGVLDVILKEIEGVLSRVDENRFSDAMASFSSGRRVFVDGEGRSGFSARGFAMRLMHLGYQVYFVGETITPAMKKGDLLVAVSGSGKSLNILNDAKKAKALGAEVLAVTSKADTLLAQIADKVLVIPGTVKGRFERRPRLGPAFELPFRSDAPHCPGRALPEPEPQGSCCK